MKKFAEYVIAVADACPAYFDAPATANDRAVANMLLSCLVKTNILSDTETPIEHTCLKISSISNELVAKSSFITNSIGGHEMMVLRDLFTNEYHIVERLHSKNFDGTKLLDASAATAKKSFKKV